MSDTPQEFSPDLDVAQDTLRPFDAREREGMNPMIKLAILVGALLLAAIIVLKLYTPGVRDRSDPPRITADNTPFKVKPEEVGGVQTPNQDKVVFEVMDGKSPDIKATPDPLPENPIKIQAPEPIVVKPEIKEPIAAPSPTPAPKSVKRPVVTPPQDTAVAVRGGEWVVQVSSTRSESDAAAAWTTLKRKFPDLVEGKYADVKRADLEEKGIYYRTRIAGLVDKTAANSLCNSFKAAGQACFVTKR